MRIDPKIFVAPVSSESAQKPAPKAPGKAASQASVVTLSSAGSAVVADADDSVPSARVEKLRAMVEAGTYKVDLEALAARIVDDEVVRGGRR